MNARFKELHRLAAFHRARFFRLARILAALVLLNLILLTYHLLNK